MFFKKLHTYFRTCLEESNFQEDQQANFMRKTGFMGKYPKA